ncbi:MAG: EAL domain-containing protein [Gemmatimonadota bacterium]
MKHLLRSLRTALLEGSGGAIVYAGSLFLCAVGLLVSGGLYIRSRSTVDEIASFGQGLRLLRMEREVGYAAGEAELALLWWMYSGEGDEAFRSKLARFARELERARQDLADFQPEPAWRATVDRLGVLAEEGAAYLEEEHDRAQDRIWLEDFPTRFTGIFPSDPLGRFSTMLEAVLGAQYSIYTAGQYGELLLSRHAFQNGTTPADGALVGVFTSNAAYLEQLGVANPGAFSPFEDDLALARARDTDAVIASLIAGVRADPAVRRIEGDFDYLVGRSRVPWYHDASEIVPFASQTGALLNDTAERVLVRAEAVLALARQRAVQNGRAALAAALAAFGLGTLVLAGLSRGRQREEAHLRSVAETDALTGISNRFALFAREQARLRDPQRAPFALLHMDLDHFKEINDRYGHSVGDAALIAFADVCRGVVRHASDTLARIGGDEFVIVLHELQDPGTEAAAVADRIRTLLQEPLDLLGHKLALKVSVGVAVAHGPVELEAFLHQADVALLDAKKDRGSRHTLFERNLHGNLIHELEEALGAGLVQPVFQPIVRATNQRVAGFEVLARWERADGSAVPSESFIRALQALDASARWLRIILVRVAELSALVPHDFGGRFWINVSLADLVATGSESVPALFRASGIPLHLLGVEVTERVCCADLAAVRDTLVELRDAGVQVALDDLGSDGVPLRHLLDLPLDRVKLDGGLIRGLERSESVRHIVQGLFAIAVHLKLQIVAEQIETPEEHRTLLQLGVTYLQGNLLGPPIAAAHVPALIEQGYVEALGGVA